MKLHFNKGIAMIYWRTLILYYATTNYNGHVMYCS